MALFTSLVVSDGTNDRTFVDRGVIPGTKPSVRTGVYIEPAADPASQSKITVKHDETSSRFFRHLLQRSELFPIDSDGTLAAATVNITINHHPNHTIADIEALANTAKAFFAQTGVVANLRLGMCS